MDLPMPCIWSKVRKMTVLKKLPHTRHIITGIIQQQTYQNKKTPVSIHLKTQKKNYFTKSWLLHLVMDFNVIAYRLEMILPSATGQREIEIGRRRELLRKGRTNYNFYTEEKGRASQLVSWYFDPSQPQRITSGLNTNFNLSASHSFHKSLYHKPPPPPQQTTAQILCTISEHKTRKTIKCFGAYL